ncbi:unnamed protein product [Peniophora sp. CBMAI 1063]|nr:unnamed protein product [Peniophora sp. CBMAI 1063]
MSNLRHIDYHAHGLSLGDFNDARWLALTKLARLIPYFVLYSLIVVIFAAFVRLVRHLRRRTRRKRLDAEHQSLEITRLQQQLAAKDRQSHVLRHTGNRNYTRMVDARAAQRRTQAQLTQHQISAALTAHRHAFQLAALQTSRAASEMASAAQLVTQSQMLDAQIHEARRHVFKAAAEAATQVAVRIAVSAQLVDQSRRRSYQSAASGAARIAARKASALELAEQSRRHDQELLAARRVTFIAVAQAAASVATNKALLAQLTLCQSQLRDSQAAQLTALQALGVNSFEEAIHNKRICDKELTQTKQHGKALENQTAVLRLTSGIMEVTHAEEIAAKDHQLRTLHERSDEQAIARAAHQAEEQEREAQLTSALASRTTELKSLLQRSDKQTRAYAAERAGAQEREASLSAELSSLSTDLKFAHEELEAVNIECATYQEKLQAADALADKREARITVLKANVQELGACASKLTDNYEERLRIAGQHARDQDETIASLRERLNELQCAARPTVSRPDDGLPSPPPSPAAPSCSTPSDDGLDPSCTSINDEDEDLPITTLTRLPPPPPVDARNRRWIGPSLRRGVLICGVFSGYGPPLVDKPSPERRLELIIDDIGDVGLGPRDVLNATIYYTPRSLHRILPTRSRIRLPLLSLFISRSLPRDIHAALVSISLQLSALHHRCPTIDLSQIYNALYIAVRRTQAIRTPAILATLDTRAAAQHTRAHRLEPAQTAPRTLAKYRARPRLSASAAVRRPLPSIGLLTAPSFFGASSPLAAVLSPRSRASLLYLHHTLPASLPQSVLMYSTHIPGSARRVWTLVGGGDAPLLLA